MDLITRRGFLKLAGAGLGSGTLAWAASARASDPLRPRPGGAGFEVSASLYAWDLHDEGVERVLDRLQELAAVNSVYLVGLMHPELRPFGGAPFPHNPVRSTWQAEDARCYWHPDARHYGRVRPRLSDFAWLNETDWLHELVTAARRRGMKTGVEFSHALIDRERMRGEFADLAQRNLHGEVTREGRIKWLQPPCPNHPDTIAFAVGLATDTVAHHGVDYVQSCIMCFDPAPPELGGGCFCEHCQRAASSFGFDLAAIRKTLLAQPREPRALADWAGFRQASVTRFYARLHEAVHALKPTIDLRYNIHSRSYPSYGIDLGQLCTQVDSMRLMDYSEQEGKPEALPAKRTWIEAVRKQLGADFPLLAAIGVRLKATPELVCDGVRISAGCGAAGITLGHYDGATFPVLRGVRAGLGAAGKLP